MTTERAGGAPDAWAVTEGHVKQFERDYADGMSIRAIARKHSFGYTTVRNHLLVAGVTLRARGWGGRPGARAR